jgi:ferredoxin
MSKPVVDEGMCTACGVCVDSCPNGALELGDIAKLADPDACTECGTCADSCPNGAITL